MFIAKKRFNALALRVLELEEKMKDFEEIAEAYRVDLDTERRIAEGMASILSYGVEYGTQKTNAG